MNNVWVNAATVCVLFTMAMHGATAQVAPISGATDAHAIRVGDMVRPAPPAPPGTETVDPQGQALRDRVLSNLHRRFDAAADPRTHLLTQQAARQHGWGYIADHFQQIDRSGTGAISFDDFKAYLQSRHGMAVSN